MRQMQRKQLQLLKAAAPEGKEWKVGKGGTEQFFIIIP